MVGEGSIVGRVVRWEVASSDAKAPVGNDERAKPVMAQNKLFAMQRAEIVDLNNEEHTLGLTAEQFQKWLRTH
ncbi:hypothetical protein Tco_0266049 [Tanacetum coccineum]